MVVGLLVLLSCVHAAVLVSPGLFSLSNKSGALSFSDSESWVGESVPSAVSSVLVGGNLMSETQWLLVGVNSHQLIGSLTISTGCPSVCPSPCSPASVIVESGGVLNVTGECVLGGGEMASYLVVEEGGEVECERVVLRSGARLGGLGVVRARKEFVDEDGSGDTVIFPKFECTCECKEWPGTQCSNFRPPILPPSSFRRAPALLSSLRIETPFALLNDTQLVLGTTVQLVFSNRLMLVNATLVVLSKSVYNSSVIVYGVLDPSSFFRVSAGRELDFSGSWSSPMCGCSVLVGACASDRETVCVGCPDPLDPGSGPGHTSAGANSCGTVSGGGIGIVVNLGDCPASTCNCPPTDYCTVFDTCEPQPGRIPIQGGGEATDAAGNGTNVTNSEVSGSVGPAPTSRELSGGEIAGIAVGAAVGVALIVAIVVGLVLISRKQNRAMFLVKQKLGEA